MSRLDEIKKKLKNSNTGEEQSTTSRLDRIKQQVNGNKTNTASMPTDLNDLYNAYSSYLKDAETSYGSMNYGNAGSTWENVNARKESIHKLIEDTRIKYNLNRSDLTEEERELNIYLNKMNWSLDDVERGFLDAFKGYSQYKTEDDYNKAVADAEEYEKKKNLDLDAYQKETERIKAELEKADPTGWKSYGGASEEIDRIKDEISEREVYYTQAKRIQEGVALSGVANPNSKHYDPEFNNYTGYKSTESDGWGGKLTSQYGLGYDDVTYEYINGADNGMRSEIYKATVSWNGDTDKWKIYDHMTKDEIAIYNYYYAKDGKEKAEEYLDSIQETLNTREATKMFGNLEDNTFAEMLFGIVAGLDQFESGVKNLFSDKDYYAPSAIQITSGMVREDLEDSGIKIFGSSLGQMGYDAITTTSNMLPSVLVGTATGGTGTVISMGASAAGNAKAEMINLGYSKAQANAYGLMVGASEALLEKFLGGIVGVSNGGIFTKLGTKVLGKVDNALARVAIQLGGSMLDEATEEMIQSVLEPWFESVVTGADFDAPDIDEVLYSGLLGALTAGVFDIGGTVVGQGAIAENNAIRKQGKELMAQGIDINKLAELGKDTSFVSADSVAYRLAGKVNEKTGAYTIARLFNEMNAQLTTQNQNDIIRSLERKGVNPKHAETIATALANVVAGVEITKKQQKAIESNPVVAKTMNDVILNQNSTVRQRMTKFNESVFPKPAEATTETSQEAVEQAQTVTPAENSTLVESAENKAENVSDDGKTKQISTGEEISIKRIASTKNGLSVELDNGSVIKASDISYSSDAEATMFDMLSRMETSPEVANEIFNSFKPTDMKQALNYFVNIPLAYNYGKIGYKQGLNNVKMSKEESYRAYNQGRKYAEAKAVADTKTPSKADTKTDANTENDGIIYENGFTYDEKKATKIQKVSMAHIDVIKQMTNLEVHVFESVIKDGKRVAFIDGKWQPAPNGFFRNGNQIYIDINAGNKGEGAMLSTMGHEVAHYIRRWNAKGFKELADFLFKHYGHNGVSVDALIEAQKDKIIKRYKFEGKELPSEAKLFDMAYEEVVADAMSDMLADPRAYEKLAQLKSQNRTLWQKIGEAIKNVLDKLKSALGIYKNAPVPWEAQHVRDFAPDVFNKLQDLYIKAFVEADANYEASSAEESDKATLNEGKSLFSIRDEYTSEIDMWVKDGMPDGETFVLGTTGDILQGLGAIENDIYILGDKIKKILSDHPEMTINEIKKIPQILENPILILKSLNKGRDNKQNTRLVLFGSVKAKNGLPVLSVMDMRPLENHIVIDDMQKVTSAYTKTNKPVDFVKESEVLYADEKKTTSLLRTIGFQMPIELNKSGFIGSISYKGQNVNIFGEKFSDVFSEIAESSDRDSLGNELSQEQQEFFKDSKVRDNKGNLKVVYHGTKANFNVFAKGDIGFHFGTKGAARGRVGTGKNVTIKEVYLNITNPISINKDLGSWNADTLAVELFNMKLLTKAEAEAVLFTDDKLYRRSTDSANKKLREVLLQKGYDGIEYRNTFESKKDSTSYIAFNSNQVKEIANQKPTTSADIRYSERDTDYMDAVNRGDMETAQKMVDEAAKKAGYTIKAYHGTARGDRVGNVFLPERATSGPMAFFTDNEQIAENYSKSKQDTSIAYDRDFDRYETQFRIKTKYQDIPLYRAWGYLPFDARNRITKKAGQLREDWDGDGDLILDPETNEANGGFQWQLKETRGNAIHALIEQWLNSGNLFNEERRFLDVLEMAGVTEEFKKIGMDSLYFKDPNEKHEKVYNTYLKISSPFNTSTVDNQFVEGLEAWYDDQDQSKYEKETADSDLWDKNNIDAYDFIERLNSDIKEGTSRAWTSIPDSVTDYLKSQGYDGIVDKGGKNGGETHTVYIPFSSEQIKYAEPVTYDDNGNVIPLSERFKSDNNDIRYSDRDTATFNGKPFWSGSVSLLDGVIEEVHSFKEAEAADFHHSMYFSQTQLEKMENGENAFFWVENGSINGDWRESVPQPIIDKIRDQIVVDTKYSERDDINQIKSNLKKKYSIDPRRVTILADSYLENYGGVWKKSQFYLQFLTITEALAEASTTGNAEALERADRELKDLADEIVNSPKATGAMASDITAIKKHLKGIRIKIPKFNKGDFDAIGGFENFRKRHMGKLLLANNGLDIDTLYPELQELFGTGYFPDNITHVADQLMKIAEVIDTPLKAEMNYDVDEAREYLVNELSDKIANIVLKQDDFNYRDTELVSNRSLLANALESVAQNDIEKNKLKQYKNKIALIESEQAKLNELRAKIKELSFAKGRRDAEQIRKLQYEANQTANRINTYDKQLLNLEATTALKNVLQREKEMAMKRERQKGYEALKAYKEKALATQREIITRNQESRKRSVENRHKTEMRHKIKKVVSDLNKLLLHGTKERNIKPGLQQAVAMALEAINMDTVSADARIVKLTQDLLMAKTPEKIEEIQHKIDYIKNMGDRMSDKLEALGRAYREIKNSTGNEYSSQFKEEATLIENKIESVISKVGKTPLRDMSMSQLEAVYDLYTMVLTTVRNANGVWRQGKLEDLQQNASAVMAEVDELPKIKSEGSKFRQLVRAFKWNNMTPYYAFDRIGSKTFMKFFKDFIEAQNTYGRDIAEVKEFANETRKKYNYNKWNLDKVYDFKLKDGRTFSTTLKHMLSIYAYSKREQALDHMSVGGFFHNDKATFRKKGGIFEMVRTDDIGYKVDWETLEEIKEALGKEKMLYVDEMQEYLTNMGEKGNEVTRVMWGIDIFKEKVYFPLKSKNDFIKSSTETAQAVSLKNDGMTKETVPGASNPIVLEAFDDVWAKHTERMSQYHAFVIPIDNLNKIHQYGTWAGTDSMAVSTLLAGRFGNAVNEYISQFIKDMNGSVVTQGVTNPFMSFFSKFKKTAVGMSLSTVVQQPTAIVRAMSLVDGKYFVGKPNLSSLSKKWEELKTYAPIAIIKEIGGFDAGSGVQVTNWINSDTKTGIDKVMNVIDDVSTKGAELADMLGWTTIWEAVKRETKATTNLAVGSEAFLKKAGERFTEVIVQTQVYDSTLSRSAFMRSKNDGVKMLTSFMGEPTLSVNMLYNAVVNAMRGGSKLKTARTIGCVYASSILASAFASAIYALNDDDEDESYLEKYMQAFGGEFISDIVMMPVTSLPAVKDVISIFQGWDIERTDVAIFKDIKDAFDGLFSETKSPYRKIEDFAGAISAAFGLPVKNLLKTGRQLYNAVNDMFVDSISGGNLGQAFLEGITNSKTSKTDKLYNAIVNGDTARLEVLRSDYDEDAYRSAIRKALRENDPRIQEAAQALYEGDVSEYGRIIDEIADEGNFEALDIKSAIESELNKIEKENSTEEDTQSEEKAESIYEAEHYYMALIKGDTYTANMVKEDLINTAVANGKSREDAEESFYSSFRTKVRDGYADGTINRTKAMEMLISYGGMESNDAYWTMDKFDYYAQYGSYEGYSKYSDFHSAVRTGVNLKSVIQEYTSHGVEAKTLASQITSYFKPLYINMTNSERAGIKGYLLNAYAQLGYNRYDKSKDIDNWLK